MLADLGLNYTERQVLLSGCSAQRIQTDYGYDLMMSTYNAKGEIEGGIVFFQVKATDDLPLLVDGRTISWTVSRRDLRLWLSEAYPVILVVYSGRRDRAFWLHIQAYFADRSSSELFLAGETLNLHFPVTNHLNRQSVRRIVERKNAIHTQLAKRSRRDV